MYAKNVVRFLILVSLVVLLFDSTKGFGVDNKIDLLRFKVDLLYKKYQLTGSDRVKELLLTEINNSLNYISKTANNSELLIKGSSHSNISRKLGLRVKQLRDHLEIKSILKDGNAAVAGLKSGDVITKVIGIHVRTIQHLEMILNSKGSGSLYNFTVIRNGKNITKKVKF